MSRSRRRRFGSCDAVSACGRGTWCTRWARCSSRWRPDLLPGAKLISPCSRLLSRFALPSRGLDCLNSLLQLIGGRCSQVGIRKRGHKPRLLILRKFPALDGSELGRQRFHDVGHAHRRGVCRSRARSAGLLVQVEQARFACQCAQCGPVVSCRHRLREYQPALCEMPS